MGAYGPPDEVHLDRVRPYLQQIARDLERFDALRDAVRWALLHAEDAWSRVGHPGQPVDASVYRDALRDISEELDRALRAAQSYDGVTR